MGDDCVPPKPYANNLSLYSRQCYAIGTASRGERLTLDDNMSWSAQMFWKS
jgi:hypothetical protein